MSRDKEACKQYAFKLFSSSGGTLAPKEGKTSRIWLQAPFKKGSTTLKLLFYYGTPAHYPKLRYFNTQQNIEILSNFCFYRQPFLISRYRMVRHTWNLNVNESLSFDATCTLNHAASHDLGIDLYVKNQNQVHHALVTEIFLSDLKLFCPTYKFVPNSIKCEWHFCLFDGIFNEIFEFF